MANTEQDVEKANPLQDLEMGNLLQDVEMGNPQPQCRSTPGRFLGFLYWLRSPWILSSSLDVDPPYPNIYSRHPTYLFPRITIFMDGLEAPALIFSAYGIFRQGSKHSDLARNKTLLAIAILLLGAYFLVAAVLGVWMEVSCRQLAAKRLKAREKKVQVLVTKGIINADEAPMVIQCEEFVRKLGLLAEQMPWQVTAWHAALHPVVRLPVICIAIPYVVWKF